jgi:hypothetical protein
LKDMKFVVLLDLLQVWHDIFRVCRIVH